MQVTFSKHELLQFLLFADLKLVKPCDTACAEANIALMVNALHGAQASCNTHLHREKLDKSSIQSLYCFASGHAGLLADNRPHNKCDKSTARVTQATCAASAWPVNYLLCRTQEAHIVWA